MFVIIDEDRSQKDISIGMLAYNHSQYIRMALDGILMQETSYSYKIVIAEDFSTDDTREIIIAYQKKHPEKFKLILQDKNVGIAKNAFDLMHNITTKYIALCEGDDYWTDPLKLQKQADFLEANPSCTICYHPSEVVYMNSKRDNTIAGPKKFLNKKEHIFTVEDLITKSLKMWTASLLFRRSVMAHPPEWISKITYADVALKLIAASKGNIGYLGGKPMSVYRRGVEGAWSSDEGKTLAWQKKRLLDHYDLLDKFNEFTHNKYNSAIQLKKKKKYIAYLSVTRPYHSKFKWLRLLFFADVFLVSKYIVRKILK